MDVADNITHAMLVASVSQITHRADHIQGSSKTEPGTNPKRHAILDKSKAQMESHTEYFNMGSMQSNRQTEPGNLMTAVGHRNPHPKQEAEHR
jgi:hypothetical protein